MVRFRSAQSGEVNVRAAMIAKLRVTRDHHPTWPEWTDHYDWEISRWESSEPRTVSGHEIRQWVPWAGEHNVVEADGTVRIIDRAERMGKAVGVSASHPKSVRMKGKNDGD